MKTTIKLDVELRKKVEDRVATISTVHGMDAIIRTYAVRRELAVMYAQLCKTLNITIERAPSFDYNGKTGVFTYEVADPPLDWNEMLAEATPL